MKDNRLIIVVLIIIVFYLISQQQPETVTEQDIDLESVIDSSVSFTGQNMYVAGTALSEQSVRIIKLNDDNTKKDLNYKSLDSGTLSTTPNVDYKFYYFMNTTPSTHYYVSVEDYKAPLRDAVDDQVGYGCEIDDSLVFSVKDKDGRTQTATANAQSISANTNVDISIRFKVHTDKCYGMPDAVEYSSKQNAVCFSYNTDAFDKVETNTKIITPPYAIATNDSVTSSGLRCHEFPVLQDGEWIEIPVTLDAGGTEPTHLHNITVYSNDIAFDLNLNNLEEIWDYQDEVNNDLAAHYITLGKIYIS